MTRRTGTLLLGLLWVGFGVLFAAIDEPRAPFGSWWEDARGWVWIAVGIAGVVAAAVGHSRWVLILMGALCGERVTVWVAWAATVRLPPEMWASLLAWVGVMVAVLSVASLPPHRR